MNCNVVSVLGALAAVAVVASMPSWLNLYYVGIATMTLVYIGYASAWNLVGGMGGQFSVGHNIFMAMGGTVTASLIMLHGWGVASAITASVVGSAVLALAMSWLLFRRAVPSLSFALITLALGEVALLLITSNDGLGSAAGVVWNQRTRGFGMTDANRSLWVALAVCIVVVAVCIVVDRSSLGSELRATRDDEAAAAALGINTMRVKSIAMVLSAVLTALVATIGAAYLVFVDPNQFASPIVVITVILYVVVGGRGTILGPILGAGILYPLNEILRGQFSSAPGLPTALFGLAIVAVVLFLPRGIAGLIDRVPVPAALPLGPRWHVVPRQTHQEMRKP